MANRAAFIHKPKGSLADLYFSPVHTKDLWNYVWALARAQDWFEEDTIGCVGNRGGFFYFQITGLTTGFARVKIDDEVAAAYAKFSQPPRYTRRIRPQA